MIKKIIMYLWQAYAESALLDALLKMGYQVIPYQRKFTDYDMDAPAAMELLSLIHREEADCLLSFNYFPLLSSIAESCTIRYMAWVYDSPHYTLFSRTIHYPGNLVFCFDRDLVNQLNAQGVKRVFHMPLASDSGGFQAVIEAAQDEKHRLYGAQVSFVGSLYDKHYNYYDKMLIEEPENRKWLDALIQSRLFQYRDYGIREELADRPDIVWLIKEKADLHLSDKYEAQDSVLAASVIGRKITAVERKALLHEVAGKYALSLYSDAVPDGFDAAVYRGYADYKEQMPLVFYNSKINLNITLRTIESGIPLRALDIMACGGFLLSNYQKELAESFADGEEAVFFYSLEDCMEKIDYYLAHEEERLEIARRGCRKVKEEFSFQGRIREMFQMADGFWEQVNWYLIHRDYDGLCRLCGTEEFIRSAVKNTKKAQVKILCDIYNLEKKEGMTETVFANFECQEDMHSYFTKLKFYLRRLEFGFAEEFQRELISFLDSTVTSRIALVQIGGQAVFDSRTTAIRLAELLGECGREEDMLPVLMWGLPKEERSTLLKELAGVDV